MSIVLGIVNHPARDPDKLICDTQPDVVLTDTQEGIGPGRMHQKMLYALTYEAINKPGCEWIVVLEDDAIAASEDFREEVVACLDWAPQPLVSLYLGTGYPAQYQRRFMEAVATGSRWILHKQLRHAVGYCVSTNIIADLYDHTVALTDGNWAMDDAITHYLRTTEHRVAYSNPSLVDHDDKGSVVKLRTHLGRATFGRKRPRKAHRFGIPLQWNDTTVIV